MPSNSEFPENESPDWIDESRAGREPRYREISLRLTVVEYAHGPDRCTVYPPGLSSVARMSTWISADRTAFESLAARR